MRSLDKYELQTFMDTGDLPDWVYQQARERAAEQAKCDHAGWSWEKHGRGCFKCGAILMDPGD